MNIHTTSENETATAQWLKLLSEGNSNAEDIRKEFDLVPEDMELVLLSKPEVIEATKQGYLARLREGEKPNVKSQMMSKLN